MTTSGLERHRNVANFHLRHGRSHTLRHPPLKVGMHSVVFRSQNVPARLRLPTNAVRVKLLLVEQIEDRRIMSGPHELLVFLGEVSGEEL
jgi:hypothetical protein